MWSTWLLLVVGLAVLALVVAVEQVDCVQVFQVLL
jgi:hypothetical protein